MSTESIPDLGTLRFESGKDCQEIILYRRIGEQQIPLNYAMKQQNLG